MERLEESECKKLSIGIESIAYCLGSDRLSNAQLGIENSDWDLDQITDRAGVFSRPVAAPNETALDLGEKAAIELFKKTGLSAQDVDALIFCTQTPDYLLPSNSSLLHARLGLNHSVMAFDITLACSGFIYALGILRSLIISGTATRALLITGDTYTRLLHPKDRSTRPLFGDGAAASLISAVNPKLIVLDMSFASAGNKADRFIIKSGGMRYPSINSNNHIRPDKSGRIKSDQHISMDGMGVLSFFTAVLPKSIEDILQKNHLTPDDVSLFVFHQASRLALEALQRRLKIPNQKILIDLSETGNLVSTSIPVALERALDRRQLQPGELLVICGFGVGLSWGTSLIRFKGY